MRRDASFLADIVDAAESIGAICACRDLESVSGDRVLSAAILHHLTVIGEAAKRLSTEFRERHGRMPWPQIVAQRNRIVHDYFGLDWDIVWTSAVEEVPRLREWAVGVLAAEFPDAEDEER